MLQQFTLLPILAKSKGEVKRLRSTGFIPVSLQHQGMETLHYQLHSGPLDEFIRKHGYSAMIDLVVDPGKGPQRAMIQSVTRNALSQKLQQVVFQQIRIDDTLKTKVSLVFSGVPERVAQGDAMLQHALDELDIECAQGSRPSHITIDVSKLGVGDVFHVSDIAVDPKYKIVNSGDTVLASVTLNRAAVSATVVTPDA